MTSLGQAIRRIDKVLDSDFDPSTAYPLRARLGRAVLASSHVAAGISPRTKSGDLHSLLNRLDAAAKHIMQPSEPFDAHWREQWLEVLADLRSLRSQLSVVASAP